MTDSINYSLYTPNIEDFCSVKLNIKSCNFERSNCYSRYYLNVCILPPEASIEGTEGLQTHYIGPYPFFSQNWTADLQFRVEKKHVDTIKFKVNVMETAVTTTLLHSNPDISIEKNKTNEIEINQEKEKISVEMTIADLTKRDIDIRSQLNLCEQEQLFCKNRKKFMQDNSKDKTTNIPKIAIIGSGGGMRAVVGMCGATKALKDIDILNRTMYIAGLSGSSWYISTLYATSEGEEIDPHVVNDVTKTNLKNVAKDLNERSQSLMYVLPRAIDHGKYISATDFFGDIIGDILLGKHWTSKWSEQRQRLQLGAVPLPLLAALRMQNSDDDWVEFSPYQVFMPKYGTGIDMEYFGSEFDRGFMSHKHMEQPVHYLQGVCGSAYGGTKKFEVPVCVSGVFNVMARCVSYVKQGFESIQNGAVPNWFNGIDKFTTKAGDIVHVGQTSETKLELTDAGIAFNSPYPIVLHPAREVDVILSFDFSLRSDDDSPPFDELKKAEQWANSRGIPFPELNLEKIEKEPLEEAYVFDGGDKKTPTIIHFVMINKDFRKFSTPGKTRDPDDKLGDFDIFTHFHTLKFCYSEKEFDGISKLMEFNVKNNEKMINSAIKGKQQQR